MISDISLGGNPKEEKVRKNDNTTFKALFDTYLEKHAKLHKKTWNSDVYFFNKYIASLANKRVKDQSTAISIFCLIFASGFYI